MTRPVYDITAYLPDALIPQYEALRDTLVSWLGGLGLTAPPQDKSAGLSRLFPLNSWLTFV